MTPGLPTPADKRFRRHQVKPTGRRGLLWRRAKVVGKSVALALVVSLAAWRAITLIIESPALQIAHIVLRGNERLSRGEALALVGDLQGQNILSVRLEDWRHKLMTSPWVEDATVRRVLPNTLDLFVRERTPMGLARLGRDLYLVDGRGVVIDEWGPSYGDLDLPIIDGLAPPAGSGTSALDERRMALASRLLADVAPHSGLAVRLSQIDVRDAHDAVVLLDGDTVMLRLGDRDFAARIKDYLGVAPALRDRVSAIDAVDLRFGERMYVRPGRGDGVQPRSQVRVGGQ